jgi:hypothetical protein
MESVEIAGETVAAKKAGSRSAERRKKHAKSRIGNGRDILPDVDGRSVIARRYREISNAILIDQGGLDRCSESRQQLIRRFAAAAVLAEQLESKLANGVTIDIGEHALLCSTLTRLAQRIGIERVARDVTPALDQYLTMKERGDAGGWLSLRAELAEAVRAKNDAKGSTE